EYENCKDWMSVMKIARYRDEENEKLNKNVNLLRKESGGNPDTATMNTTAVDHKGSRKIGQTCFFCKKHGHLKRDCEKKKQWDEKNKSTSHVSSQEKMNVLEVSVDQFQEDSRPKLEAKKYNLRIQILLDSGATANFISSETVNQLGLEFKAKPQKTNLAVGSTKIIGETELELKITKTGAKEKLVLKVIPNLSSNIIIGANGLEQHGLTINYVQREIIYTLERAKNMV
ncbi:putative LTR transposable element, partial [Pseudoloma neurophilia]